MNFLDDVKDEEYYENINQTIIDGNVMNMSLIIMEVKYGAIDTDDYSCRGYYIIKFYSYPYTLQADLSIDDKVISSGVIVCEGTYLFPININSHYYVLQETKSINAVVYLRTIINGNANVIFYYSKDVVPLCLRSISHNGYITLSPLHIPMKEHDIIMDGNNQREGIEF